MILDKESTKTGSSSPLCTIHLFIAGELVLTGLHTLLSDDDAPWRPHDVEVSAARSRDSTQQLPAGSNARGVLAT